MKTCYSCKGLAGERDLHETEIIRVYCRFNNKIQVFNCIDKPVGAKPLQDCKGVYTWAAYYEEMGRRKHGKEMQK